MSEEKLVIGETSRARVDLSNREGAEPCPLCGHWFLPAVTKRKFCNRGCESKALYLQEHGKYSEHLFAYLYRQGNGEAVQ